MLTSFAGHVRRHLVAENAILLPIARARLTRADLARLSAHMRARRGLTQLSETPNAE
jgi:hemerythrin-like domain-containing protein